MLAARRTPTVYNFWDGNDSFRIDTFVLRSQCFVGFSSYPNNGVICCPFYRCPGALRAELRYAPCSDAYRKIGGTRYPIDRNPGTVAVIGVGGERRVVDQKNRRGNDLGQRKSRRDLGLSERRTIYAARFFSAGSRG